uniref:Uncharacterized protein n=1 Tax=Arundo donax TaxID=35708 RepID=A0A0A8XV93_ARUDO
MDSSSQDGSPHLHSTAVASRGRDEDAD